MALYWKITKPSRHRKGKNQNRCYKVPVEQGHIIWNVDRDNVGIYKIATSTSKKSSCPTIYQEKCFLQWRTRVCMRLLYVFLLLRLKPNNSFEMVFPEPKVKINGSFNTWIITSQVKWLLSLKNKWMTKWEREREREREWVSEWVVSKRTGGWLAERSCLCARKVCVYQCDQMARVIAQFLATYLQQRKFAK